jgi:hypothetical protein
LPKLPEKKRKRRKKESSERRNKRVLILVTLVLLVFAAGVVVITNLNPLNLGKSISPVIVIIPAGSAENPRLSFTPSLVRIVIGVNNTVIWKNEDSEWHTAHSNIPEFDSKMIPPGTSFTHTFQRSGSYPYHCDPHPWMTGLIIVVGSDSLALHRIGSFGISPIAIERFR